MTSLLLRKSIQYCPIVQVLVLASGTLLSFLIAFHRGNVNGYLPFISETGAYSPEKGLFSLCLILGSILGIIIVFCRFILISECPLNENQKFSRLNNGSLIIGVLSMIGLAGVAAFPMTTVFWAHLTFATMYFLGSAIYFALVTITTFEMEGKSKFCLLRFVLTSCITIFLFLLVVLFPLSLKRWHKHNDNIPALKKPENEGFTLVFISSLLEWSVELIITIYTLSLTVELKKHGLMISVISEQFSEVPTIQQSKDDLVVSGQPASPLNGSS